MAVRKRKRPKKEMVDYEYIDDRKTVSYDPMSDVGLYVMVVGFPAVDRDIAKMLWVTAAFLVIVLFRWVMKMLNMEG